VIVLSHTLVVWLRRTHRKVPLHRSNLVSLQPNIMNIMETSELLILDVQTAGNKFSQECPVCSQPIVYMASVAYCQCALHFHPKCFQQVLNGKDLTEEPKVQCLYCRAEIQTEYKVEFIPNFNRDRCTLGNILLIVALALFLGTLATSVVVLLNFS
jgi:hypothetical protein